MLFFLKTKESKRGFLAPKPNQVKSSKEAERMSQVVATIENTVFVAGPLSEVTKSRTSLENSLANNQGKKAKAKAHSSGPIKPWSSMTSEEVAIITQKLNQEEDDEAMAPTRRRAPPPKGAATTVTSYSHQAMAQSVPSSPNRVHVPVVPAPRTNGNSPVSAYPTPSAPNAQYQHCQNASFPMQPSLDQFTGGSATPLQEQVEPEVHVVTVRRNDPYGFNVLGNQTTVASMLNQQQPTTTTTTTGYYPPSNNHNQSYDSYCESEASTTTQSTVGYVNSAEVSPVKNQTAQNSSAPALYSTERRRPNANTHSTQWSAPHQMQDSGRSSPFMQQQNSYSSAPSSVPSTPTVANPPAVGKLKRVYVNGRPVIHSE